MWLTGKRPSSPTARPPISIIVVAKTDPSAGAKGTSLIVVETEEAEGFARGRKLDKVGLDAQDTSELFFNDGAVPDLEPARRGGRAGLRPAHAAIAAGAAEHRGPAAWR